MDTQRLLVAFANLDKCLAELNELVNLNVNVVVQQKESIVAPKNKVDKNPKKVANGRRLASIVSIRKEFMENAKLNGDW